MTFEVNRAEVEKLKALPQVAIQQLLSSLSDETEKRLIKVSAELAVEILADAIEKNNLGSIESIYALVRPEL